MKRVVVSAVTALVVATVALVGGAPPAPVAAQTPPAVPEPYVGVTPIRVLEPVVGGIGGGPMGTGDVRTLTVTGSGGVPAAVEAVDLTVTATRQASGLARVFVSTGGTTTTVPALSVRNVGGQQTATVTVVPSATGEIAVRASAALDVQVEVRGYFAADSGFTGAASPTTVLSTSTGLGGGRLAAAETREIGVVGIGEVPATDVSAVVARLVVSGTTDVGVVRVAPAGSSTLGEAVRINNGVERVTSVIVGLGQDGGIQVRSTVDADALLVVDGWFDESGAFTPVVPTTVVDNLLVQPAGIRTAASGAVLPDTGVAAVAVQVVATGTTTVGTFSLRAGPGQETPAMTVGGPTGMARGGSAVWTPVRADGTFDVHLSAGMPATRVTVSIVGWTAGPVASGDTALPSVTVESPTPGGGVDASDAGSFTMVIAASDPGSGVAAVAVTVAGNTVPARLQMSGSALRWVADVPGAASGSRGYVVEAIDRAGNVGSVTATYTLTAPAPEATVLDPDTTVVDETVGELTSYDAGTGVMVFAGDVTATVRPGQILASDPTTLAPQGYLRMVNGVSVTGSTTTVRTRQAVVTEAVRQADIDVTLPPQQSARSATAEIELTQTFPAELTLEATYVSGGLTTTFALAGGVTASVGLHIKIKIALSWLVVPKVEHFEAIAEASLAVSASETISGEFTKSWTRPTPILSVNLGAIATPIPGLVITPELIIDADASVTVAGALSASFSTGKRFQVGVIYDGEDWEKVAEEGNIGGGFTIQQEGSIEFTAEAGISARLNISVNDTVGLWVEARAGIELSGAAATGAGFECNARVGLTVSAGTDIQIPLIDVTLVDIPFGEIPLADWDLFNVSCPSGVPVDAEVEGTDGAFAGQEEILSVSPEGDLGDRGGYAGSASHGAGVVAFTSAAGNLVPGATVNRFRVYVREVASDTTELVSVGTGGTDPNGPSDLLDITPNGRYVSFMSASSNLVAGTAWTGGYRLYLYDRQTDTTELLVGHTGHPCDQVASNFGGTRNMMTPDARFVYFGSTSPCVAGDTNNSYDTFLLDRTTGTIQRVSVDATGGQRAANSFAGDLSADGRYATFTTSIPPAPGHPNGALHRWDRTTGAVQVVSYDDGGVTRLLVDGAMDASGHRFFGLTGGTGAIGGYCSWTGTLVDLAAGSDQQLTVECTESGREPRADLSADGRFVSFSDPDERLGVVVERATEEHFVCPTFGDALSEDGRFLYGHGEVFASQPHQAVRMRCR